MKISCPSCTTIFAVEDSRVIPNGLTIKCPKCTTRFSVQPPHAGDEGKVLHGVAVGATAQHKIAAEHVEHTMVDSRAPDTIMEAPKPPDKA